MLSAGLWGLIGVGLIQFFLPFNQTADLIVAGFGVLIFSGYVVYDTLVRVVPLVSLKILV
jgi:FtsH-binding integral membrane protein